MSKQHRAKVFRSGNSLALRLPKGLGILEGEELVLIPHTDGSLSMWRESQALDVLMGLYGAFSPSFMSGGRGDIEQADYDWSAPAHRGKAA